MEFPRITLTPTDHEVLALFSDRAWIVGGRPRDEFFSAQRGERILSKDHDYLVTGRTYEQVLAILRRAQWSADVVGANFGVAKGRKGDLEVDVAIPRKEISTGERHQDFKVEFGPHISVEDDLGRRDITINAIAINLKTGEVKAVPRAMEDLEAKIARVITPNSIPEDPLRMLRIVGQAARFGLTIEPYTREQIQKHAHLIKTIPGERVQEELNKLMLRSPRPSVGWRLMAELGLLQYVAPEYVPAIGLKQNLYHDLDVWGHDLKAVDRAAKIVHEGGLEKALKTGTLDKNLLARILVYGAFMHDVGKPETAEWKEGYGNSFHQHEHVGASMSRRILSRWMFSEFEKQGISGIVKLHMYPHIQLMEMSARDPEGANKGIRRLLRTAAETQPLALEAWWEVQYLVRQCDVLGGKKTARWRPGDENHKFYDAVMAELHRVPALNVRDLAINGHDLMEMYVANGWEKPGFRGNRLFGQSLDACLDAVVDNPAANDRDTLLRIAHQIAAEHYGEQDRIATVRTR